MTHKLIWAAAGMAAALCASTALAGDPDKLSVSNLSWIAGEWHGQGPNDYDGKEQTIAFWTPPIEGVMSWTFRYHTPETGHVHYAFTVLEDVDNGVTLRGIHHGRDFRNYEDIHWTYRMTAASDNLVRFDCIENCRGAKNLSFERVDDDHMLEKYELADESKEPSMFRYQRASGAAN